jgi:hypothetical protein
MTFGTPDSPSTDRPGQFVGDPPDRDPPDRDPVDHPPGRNHRAAGLDHHPLNVCRLVRRPTW